MSNCLKAAGIAAALLAVLMPRISAAQDPVLVRGGEETPAAEFAINLESSPAAYAGTYHFGDSEWESDLTLSVQGDRVTGELTFGHFENGGAKWVEERVRLEEGRIVGAMLIAPEWSGVFVQWQGEKGLVMFRAPRGVLDVEFGYVLQ